MTTTAQLITLMGEGYEPRPGYWVMAAAGRFAGIQTDDLEEAAAAVIAHFAPTGDEARDTRRRANGYTVTDDAYTIRRTILRAFS